MFSNLKDQLEKVGKDAAAYGQQAGQHISKAAQQTGEQISAGVNKIGANSPIPGSLEDECIKATKILSEFVGKEHKDKFENFIPPRVFKNAKGLAIFSVMKAGFLWSGRAGSGLVLARKSDGVWGAPSAIGVAGMSFGAQLGAELTDIIIVLNTEEAVKAFASGGNVTLGGSLSITAGPVGAGTEGSIAADFDNRKVASMFSYAKSKGLFAGMSIEGTIVFAINDANTKLYGRPIKPEMILSGDIEPPAETQVLIEALNNAELEE